MSGPGRLNFATLPSNVPWPISTTNTTASSPAAVELVERLDDLVLRRSPGDALRIDLRLLRQVDRRLDAQLRRRVDERRGPALEQLARAPARPPARRSPPGASSARTPARSPPTWRQSQRRSQYQACSRASLRTRPCALPASPRLRRVRRSASRGGRRRQRSRSRHPHRSPIPPLGAHQPEQQPAARSACATGRALRPS